MMLSHIIAIILAVILFITPLLKFPNLNSKQWKLLGLATVGMFWIFSEFIPTYFFFNNEITYFLNKMSFALSFAMFGALLIFIYDVLDLKWNRYINYALILIYIPTIILTGFTDFFTQGIKLGINGIDTTIPGVGYYWVLVLMVITIILINTILLIRIRDKNTDQREKLIYKSLFNATSLPALIGLTFNLLLPKLGFDVPPIAHITYTITSFIFLYTIYKHRAFDINHVDIPIWTKIFFIVNSITITVILTSFFTYYQVAQQSIQTAVNEQLHTTAQGEKDEVEDYLNSLISTTEYIATNTEIINSIEQSIPTDKMLEANSRALITNWNVYDLLAIDKDGNIYWSSLDEIDIDTNIQNKMYLHESLVTAVEESFETGKPYLTDYSYYKPSDQRISFLAIPVLDSGRSIGTLVLKLDYNFFSEFLTGYYGNPSLHLIQNNGEIIFPENKNPSKAELYLSTPASEKCINENISHTHENIDTHTYRSENGDNVMAITTIVNNDWCLILETDETVAMKDLNNMLTTFMYYSIIISVLVAFFSYLLSRRITRPIVKLSKELSHLDLTSVTKQLKVERKDEVGQLAKVFNDMTLKLKTAQVEVMRKVSKQTEEIGKTKTKLEEQQSAIMNILQDIEVEKEITATQRDRLDIILKSIGDGVFVVDKDLNVTMINQQASIISGYTSKEVINKSYKETLKFVNEATLEPVEQFINDAISKGETMNMPDKTLIITKSGEYIPVADSAAPLKNEAGDIMGCVIIFRDITNEKELDEMKTEFLSVAAHQLRTPLGSMRWNIEMLISEDIEKLSEPMKEILQQVYDSNQRMAILVDDLLNTSRIDQERIDDKPEETDVISIIKDAITEIKPIAKQKSINVLLQLEDSEYDKVLLDPKKFREVIQNLLSNAVKYNKDKGEVYVTVKKEVSIPCGLQISIKDTGMGIPKKDQQKLFRKFFRADNAIKSETEGSGLGLFVVKSYIEDWGGTITYESEENKGSTFNICLPNKPEETKLNINLKDKPQNNE